MKKANISLILQFAFAQVFLLEVKSYFNEDVEFEDSGFEQAVKINLEIENKLNTDFEKLDHLTSFYIEAESKLDKKLDLTTIDYRYDKKYYNEVIIKSLEDVKHFFMFLAMFVLTCILFANAMFQPRRFDYTKFKGDKFQAFDVLNRKKVLSVFESRCLFCCV